MMAPSPTILFGAPTDRNKRKSTKGPRASRASRADGCKQLIVDVGGRETAGESQLGTDR